MHFQDRTNAAPAQAPAVRPTARCAYWVRGLPGPQKRGIGGTLIVVGIAPGDRGHPPAGAHRFSQRSFLAEDGRSRFVVSPVPNCERPGTPGITSYMMWYYMRYETRG